MNRYSTDRFIKDYSSRTKTFFNAGINNQYGKLAHEEIMSVYDRGLKHLVIEIRPSIRLDKVWSLPYVLIFKDVYHVSGETKPTSDAIKLCQFFNVSSDYLLGLSDKLERN